MGRPRKNPVPRLVKADFFRLQEIAEMFNKAIFYSDTNEQATKVNDARLELIRLIEGIREREANK